MQAPPLVRTFDAERLNELGNHPAIRPTCGGDGRSFLEFSGFVADRRNYAVLWDKGAFLFCLTEPDVYEVHIMVLPEGRGRAAYRKAKEGISYMLARGMKRLWARVSNLAIAHYTRAAGFVRFGTEILDIGAGPVTYDLYKWDKPCRQQ
jgi:hypothetical protein